jgi:hypothetical protein
MTANNDLDRQLNAFLTDGPTRMPDASFDAVRDRTEQTRQRVVLGPWRVPTVSKLVPIGLGAAAVIAVLFLGSRFIGSPSSNVGGPASQPPASAAPSEAAASAAPSPSQPADGSLPEGPFVYEPGGDLPSITVDIPASGWSFDPGFEVLGKGDDVENLPEAALLLWSWPAGTAFDVYGDPCHWDSTRPATPATTVDEIAAALAAQPSRDASEPVDVTVGGYTGKKLTLHVPNDFDETSNDCDQDNFASYGVAGDPSPARHHQGGGQIDELWILDVGGGFTILDATYRPDTTTELLEEMRGIAESATFESQ